MEEPTYYWTDGFDALDYDGNRVRNKVAGLKLMPPRDSSIPDIDRKFFRLHRLIGDMLQNRKRFTCAKFKKTNVKGAVTSYEMNWMILTLHLLLAGFSSPLLDATSPDSRTSYAR